MTEVKRLDEEMAIEERTFLRAIQRSRLLAVDFGRAVSKERERRGMSLREFARRLKISAAYMSDIQLGRRPAGSKLRKRIMNAL